MLLFLTAWFVLACLVAFPLARVLRGISQREEAAVRAAAPLPPAVAPLSPAGVDAGAVTPWTSPPRSPLAHGG